MRKKKKLKIMTKKNIKNNLAQEKIVLNNNKI